MIINSSGVTKAEITDYLDFWTSKMQEVFGADFSIKKEGIIDNIATAGSLTCMALEDVMMYLVKQMNPYTAESEFQDALYALVGLERQYATFTKVTRTIEGTAGTVCDVGSIRFKNSSTDDIFELNTSVTIGVNGKAVGSFTAIELGAIDLPSTALLNIIDAPEGITGVYYTAGNVTDIGKDYEDDSAFRIRWIATNSVKGGNTEGGMYAALLPLCNNDRKNLVIRQNRATQDYNDFGLHTMNIVLKSAESDTTIANAIFDNLMDGVGLYGTTSVTVKDLSDENVTIYFDRATSVMIYFNVELVLKDNFILSQVVNQVKQAIADNFNYAMGERIVANDFYQYINAIEGVDYVTTLEIKTGESGDIYGQTKIMDYNEYGITDIDNITVAEAS